MSRWIYVTLLPVINGTYREFFNFIQIREKNVRVTELSIDQREYLHFLANIEFICFARVIQLLRMLKVINLGYKCVLKKIFVHCFYMSHLSLYCETDISMSDKDAKISM